MQAPGQNPGMKQGEGTKRYAAAEDPEFLDREIIFRESAMINGEQAVPGLPCS
jgi:hypothetical protein